MQAQTTRTSETPLTAAEQLTVVALCLENDKLTAAASACKAGIARIAELEHERSELIAAMCLCYLVGWCIGRFIA